MNYELALKLKQAGFPQKGFEWDIVECVNGDAHFIEGNPPTLSELIDLCGDDADGNRNIDHPFSSLNLKSDMKTWEAECWFVYNKGVGLTPEEAVAKLWLALHK
jgi:hypothetical protein